MKKNLIFCLVVLAAMAVQTAASAQIRRRPPGPPGTNPPATNPPTTNPPTTPPPGPGGTVKSSKSFDTTIYSSGNEFGGTVKKSLRNVYGYDVSTVDVADRAPLAYEHNRADDVVFSHFIWRDIDAREKMNRAFIYPGKENEGDQRFFSIILDALKDPKNPIPAFSNEDDRFTTYVSYDSLLQEFSSSTADLDTQLVTNLYDQNILDTVIRRRPNPRAIRPDSIYMFRIKEQVFFDKESSRLFTRIIGIAPMAIRTAQPGTNTPSLPYPLFWVYYPDLRYKLAQTFVYNPKNTNGRMSWEDLFENRFFSSYITKSSMDNPSDQTLRLLIKDPLFRLLEGENIKEKIFNYEQNLWAY
ncbi:MAG: gliding motility protein GldN [Chitinophagaceae bacterium]|jgi:gliding motility associated protien GldN|nr:gliding motility protein GldN [Chitinophagaceae bacterium]